MNLLSLFDNYKKNRIGGDQQQCVGLKGGIELAILLVRASFNDSYSKRSSLLMQKCFQKSQQCLKNHREMISFPLSFHSESISQTIKFFYEQAKETLRKAQTKATPSQYRCSTVQKELLCDNNSAVGYLDYLRKNILAKILFEKIQFLRFVAML